MKTVISRRYGRFSTTGKLVVFDQDNKVLELVTIELPDLNNQHNCSCVPEGFISINYTETHIMTLEERNLVKNDIPSILSLLNMVPINK